MNGIISKLIIATMTLLLVILAGCKQTTADPDTFYYVHSDHLNVPTVVTNKDKAVVWEGHRKPFGETEVTVATIEQPFRFPGQYYDQETGLHYNLMRDYDPRLGRYVESDPIGLTGGMNTYGYAGQNSIMAYDPNGEFWFLLFAGVGGGITTAEGLVWGLIGLTLLYATAHDLSNVVSNTSTNESCGNCASKYPNYVLCSSLYGYDYSSKNAALASFGGSNNSLHNPSPATGGPCAGTSGAGMHWNVRFAGQRVGSITSCTCCEDSSGGPNLKTKYRTH